MKCILLYLVALICFSFASNPFPCVEQMWVGPGLHKGANFKKFTKVPFSFILFNCCHAPAKKITQMCECLLNFELPCIITMCYYHVLLSCVIIMCYYHVLLSCVIIMRYYHVLLPCVINIS